MLFNICVERHPKRSLSSKIMDYHFPGPKKEKYINVHLVVKAWTLEKVHILDLL